MFTLKNYNNFITYYTLRFLSLFYAFSFFFQTYNYLRNQILIEYNMSGIRLGADSFSTYEEGIKKEWIIGNGLGGYASSAVNGAATRTYHGLLVAAPETSSGRFLLLSSLDEEISINEEIYKLATHKYPGTIYPTGFN